ncbi:MAG: Adenylate kinase [Candidatus Woesebacteria bacterium GW2011_GWB1_41_10]|uniref:Adenylate kinase n=1 Tax=Candidatus Woesebacteria bacterium GW2011_GWB1_41_10 TaxID=1618577 RepID=A0A0G0UIG2_9BACT|nr:MAG: Adenylate kinase [Candidatus Woesebacteria bacterium GW2011_GWB1_41_10]
MNILFLGQQGSGKGTQARLLTAKFGFHYFESGAYLRRVAEKNEAVRKTLEEGKLVPDEEMTSYLTAFLDQQNLYDNIVFDGFPRTLTQYDFLKSWLTSRGVKLDLVIVLTISDEETVRRLSTRRTDPETGGIYNFITNPPPAGVDVSRFIQRDDDKPEAIKERLNLYKERTEPLIAELKKETKVVEINGERPIEVIASDLEKFVNDIH